MTGLVFIDALRGWAVQGDTGPDGRTTDIVYTSDGGRTWRTELPYAAGQLVARDGRIWAASGALPVFGGGTFGSRTTIWRREYSGGSITLVDTGTGASAGGGSATATLLLAGAGALFVALGLRARTSAP